MPFYRNARCTLLASIVGALVVFCQVATAQDKPVEDVGKLLVETQTYAKALREAAEALKAENTELRKRVEGKEAALWTKFYETRTAEYTFQQEMLDVNISAFRHQKVASYVILLLVVLVVGGGLFFAHVQLMAGLQPIAAAAAAAAVQAGGDNAAVPAPAAAVPAAAPNFGVNTFSAEMGKVTITSSVVGVVVLVISLAFLFIYTREVYHIQVIDPYRPTIADPNKPKPDTSGTKNAPVTKP